MLGEVYCRVVRMCIIGEKASKSRKETRREGGSWAISNNEEVYKKRGEVLRRRGEKDGGDMK